MKSTLRLLSFLLAISCSVPALAVVDPYEVLEITPAEGTVTSLQNFVITFGDLPVVVNENAVPTLEKGGGATHQGTMRAAEDGKTVLVDFEVCCTASGQYFLNIPENSITVNGQRLLPLTLRFTIEGDMNSFLDQITIDPAQGEVESLENFRISLPQYVGDIDYSRRATLTNTTTNVVYETQMIGVGFNVLVYTPRPVTDPGEYTLTVPAGAIQIYTLGEEVPELSFKYTIAPDSLSSFYSQITIDPAQGHVESLQNFTITFPQYVSEIAPGSVATLTNTTTGTTRQAAMIDVGYHVLVNFDEEMTEEGRYTLTIPAGAVVVDALGQEVHELKFDYVIAGDGMPSCTINPAEGEAYWLQYFTIAYGEKVIVDENIHPCLVNDETGDTYECSLMEIGGNAVIYKESPLSILGSYTLIVPANCIEIESSGQRNAEMNFHYTIVEKEVYVPTVIDNQPEGELRLYQRSGGVVREVEKNYTVDEGENPYEIVYEQQDGAVAIVFGADNKVYIQRPVSWSFYDGWIEGTLSSDGKMITVPMGQYIAYARSLEMAVQVGLFVYDDAAGTYVYDPSITELTYTVHDDGTITQDDTNQYVILGTMNRAFGEVFQYLDYEWLQAGDYGSVYTLAAEQPIAPPADLETEKYYLTTASFDGAEWEAYSATVEMGFDGDDVWLQGISKFLPEAWIKGTLADGKVTFPNPQLLGAFESLFYFKSADYDLVNGQLTQKDMVLTCDEDGFKTYDYIFITTDKEQLYFVNYYQGLTLSKYPDALIEAPEGLEAESYYFKYKTYNENNVLREVERVVKVGFSGNDVYIQGLWEYLPEAWITGHLADGKLVLDLPQYMGVYEDEYVGKYPIYLIGFDNSTGKVETTVTLDYNPGTHVFGGASTPFGVGINKTGYLNLEDFLEATLTPVNPYDSVISIVADGVHAQEYFDLQGRRIADPSSAQGIVIVKNSDGSVTKVLKK